MGEYLFYAMLAMACAVIAVDFILPAFNDFLQRQIVFDYLSDPSLTMGLITLALLSGVAACACPPTRSISTTRPTAARAHCLMQFAMSSK